MGLETVVRTFLEQSCPRAFQTQITTTDITTAVRDSNGGLRAVNLCYNDLGLFDSTGLRTWGQVLWQFWQQIEALYASGVDEHVEQLDGKCPRAKEWTQHKRKKASEKRKRGELAKAAPGELEPNEEKPALVSGFRWPEVDDDQPWFHMDEQPKCSMNAVYGKNTLVLSIHPVADITTRLPSESGTSKSASSPITLHSYVYRFLCHWLLYEAPVPRTKTLILGCAQLAGHDCNRPMRVHVDALGTRRVDMMHDWPAYWTRDSDGTIKHNGYQEADDLISGWVYHFASKGKGVLVLTQDGDITLSLMMTYRSRVEALGKSLCWNHYC
jgi:phage FluMu protein Com